MRDTATEVPVSEGDAAAVEVREPWSKRAFDIVLSGLGLILSAPLWLVIAAAVKLEDGGPVFYAQERWGKGKRRIRVYKFRTMVPDADWRYGPVQARKDDPRVTRVGRILRATALDELPQLWSILKGDMSFVGPRALLINEVCINEGTADRLLPDEAIPGFRERSAVRPGLTGMAQVFAPRDIPRRYKFRYDVFYIRRMSLWLDLRLIAISVLITLMGAWEEADRFRGWLGRLLRYGPAGWRRKGRGRHDGPCMPPAGQKG